MLAAMVAVALAMGCGENSNCNAAYGGGHCSGDDQGTYCACRSGRAGDDCSIKVSPRCVFNDVNLTKTENLPRKVAIRFDDDKVHIELESPLVRQRSYTIISIDDSAFGKEKCMYP